ncbi:hypothetical protein [Nonomuraea glycinis]|uniref:hypothetical protein n=1 Tax=Nonomuraea glycinis TaxID=2047744 RepID=UPI0033A95FC7
MIAGLLTLAPPTAEATTPPPPATAIVPPPATAAVPPSAAAPAARPSVVGDVIIFNDEIVEPVSAPVSTCGALLPVLTKGGSSVCQDASRVSDDDA